MENNSNKSFKSFFSLVIVFAIFTGLLVGGVVLGEGFLNVENGIESLINGAKDLSLNERNEFVNGLKQSQLDVLREETKNLTKNQKNPLLDMLNRNDDFDVLMRNILLTDKGNQLKVEDVINKLENRSKNKLEKFIKEAIFLTSISNKNKDVIRFIVNELPEVNKDTYLDYVKEAKEIFLGMSEKDIKEVFNEYANLEKSQREGIANIIMILNQEYFDIDTTGFESIAYDINEMVMYCGYDNLGTRILLRMFEYLSGIGATYVVYDQADNVYNVELGMDIPDSIKDAINTELQSANIIGRDVTTLEDLLQDVEQLINKHSKTEIYNFKKFLNEKFVRVYSGNLPVPETKDGDDPVTPPPSTPPSNGDKDDGTPPIVTPTPEPGDIVTPTPEPEDIETPGIIFTDIENHWAKEHIIKLAQLGIVSGYTDNTIKPNDNITRAEMAVIIVKVASLKPAENINLDFVDKDEIPKWAAGYIQTAVDNKIITGYEDNTFRASKNLTREEMIVLIIKASGIEVGTGPKVPAFTDAEEIGSWALDFVAKSVELDIVAGYSDNTFKPKRNVTRAETFTVLDKILDKDKR